MKNDNVVHMFPDEKPRKVIITNNNDNDLDIAQIMSTEKIYPKYYSKLYLAKSIQFFYLLLLVIYFKNKLGFPFSSIDAIIIIISCAVILGTPILACTAFIISCLHRLKFL